MVSVCLGLSVFMVTVSVSLVAVCDFRFEVNFNKVFPALNMKFFL